MFESNHQSEPWPFEDEPETIAFTTSHVLTDLKPVIHVARDLDNNWQFLSAEGADESRIKTVSLKTILKTHPEIAKIANLPMGWEAWRPNENTPWNRRRDPDAK